jgi:predicted ester cyclase
MKRRTVTLAMSVLVLCALTLSACQALSPASIALVAVNPAPQEEKAAMAVIDQFFKAYEDYDVDTLLSLHTDDATWTWIDPGKNFPDFGPEGIMAGKGKAEIAAMFKYNRGDNGFTGYPVWTTVHGNTVEITGQWNNDYGREIGVPLVAHATFRLRQGKIYDWVWTCSPESSRRYMNTPDKIWNNKQLMVEINEEIYTKGKVELIDQYYASNYVRHEYAGDIVGLEAYKQYVQGLRAGFPDWKCTLEYVVAEGDMVVERFLCQGTQIGAWMGLPPTGKHIQFTSAVIHKIVDGKVVEDWVDYDSLGAMQQLGFVLAPGQ